MSFRQSLRWRELVEEDGGEEGRERQWQRRRRTLITIELREKRITTHSSPVFSTLNKPHSVPTSLSRISSTRFAIVPAAASAMRLLSVFHTRRIHETFKDVVGEVWYVLSVRRGQQRRWEGRDAPEIPFSVITKSGFICKILYQRV
jgi:hypothetical protein